MSAVATRCWSACMRAAWERQCGGCEENLRNVDVRRQERICCFVLGDAPCLSVAVPCASVTTEQVRRSPARGLAARQGGWTAVRLRRSGQ